MTKSKQPEGSAGSQTAEKELKPKATKKAAKPAASKAATFSEMAAGYLAQLEEEGRSESTINGYRAELKLGARGLGEERPLDELTVAEVEAFLGSEAVTMTRDGRPKSKLSTDRTARVLRQSLAWARDHGLVKEVPLPQEQS